VTAGKAGLSGEACRATHVKERDARLAILAAYDDFPARVAAGANGRAPSTALFLFFDEV